MTPRSVALPSPPMSALSSIRSVGGRGGEGGAERREKWGGREVEKHFTARGSVSLFSCSVHVTVLGSA